MEIFWLLFGHDSLWRLLPSPLCCCNIECGWGNSNSPFTFIIFPVEYIPPSNEISLLTITEVLFTSNRFSSFKVIFYMQFDDLCNCLVVLMSNDEGSLQLDLINSPRLSLISHHSKGTEVFPILGFPCSISFTCFFGLTVQPNCF